MFMADPGDGLSLMIAEATLVLFLAAEAKMSSAAFQIACPSPATRHQ
jgi:hypothetical protein